MLSFGRSGDNLGFNVFLTLKVDPLFSLIIHILMGHPDDAPADHPVQEPSKTIKTRVPISKDETGCPALPSITRLDNIHIKSLQSALREYCTAHICKEYSSYHDMVSDTIA